MAIYGYCRISTPQQSIDRQVRNIAQAYPDAVIVREAYTGTTFNRSEWLKITKALKEGDTIVFDSVSRMSRDADEGFKVYEELFHKGINLIFLKERHIDTQAYEAAMQTAIPELQSCGDEATDTFIASILQAINRFMMAKAKADIFKAFEQSEKEVADLHQRTREGIQTARLNGKQIGQRPGAHMVTKKSIAAKEIIRKHSKDFGGSLNDLDTIKLSGVSHNSYYKYKRELLAEANAERQSIEQA